MSESVQARHVRLLRAWALQWMQIRIHVQSNKPPSSADQNVNRSHLTLGVPQLETPDEPLHLRHQISFGVEVEITRKVSPSV